MVCFAASVREAFRAAIPERVGAGYVERPSRQPATMSGLIFAGGRFNFEAAQPLVATVSNQ